MKHLFLCTLLLLGMQVAASAAVIDEMNDTAGWTVLEDSGAVASISPAAGFSGNGMKLTYDFTSGGSFVEAGKGFTTIDFSRGDQVRFAFKGSGSANDLQVQIVDADGSVFFSKLNGVTNQPDWTEAALSFSGAAPDFQHLGIGDSFLDITRIAKIKFEVIKNVGGEGTLSIDNVHLFLSSPETITVHNFDALSGANNLGGISGSFTDGASGTCVETYVSTLTFGGAGALELKYNVNAAGAFSGFFTQLNAADVRETSHVSFWVRGAAGGERFRIQLRGITDAHKVQVSDYVTVSASSWQEVLIPLANFTAFISTGPAGPAGNEDEMAIVFENNINGQPNPPFVGTVYIDEIRFLQPGGDVIRVFDTMDKEPASIGNWISYGQMNGGLRSVAGASGIETDRAVEIPYKFVEGVAETWAGMESRLAPNVAQDTVFRFRYKGTGGTDNIEFKVSDDNDVVYRKVLFGATETADQHKTAEIPFSELTYFSGGTGATRPLDLTKIKKIWFTVAKNRGSRGVVTFDELESLVIPSQQFSPGSVLATLTLPANPVSPNGDGINDKARFVYRLASGASGVSTARVKLEIFTLKGESIYSAEQQQTSDGNEHVIEWDAADRDGERVRNGLYFFVFSAEGDNGAKDKVKHLLGIIR